jgi:hypothetical protein
MLLEDHGVVVLLVFGAVHQRHRAMTHVLPEFLDHLGVLFELSNVPAPELRPRRGFVAEPSPQAGAGSDLLEPQIDSGVFLG